MLRPKMVKAIPMEAYDIGLIKPKNPDILPMFSSSSIHSLLFFLTFATFNGSLLMTSCLNISTSDLLY